MIKDDLVKRIAAKFDLSQNLTGKVVQAFLDELVDCLVEGPGIELRRFGVFATKKQKARVIILPSGEKVTRPARKIVTFSASATVKRLLNPPAPSWKPGKATKPAKEKVGKYSKIVAALMKDRAKKA